jgi:hypothetical protein
MHVNTGGLERNDSDFAELRRTAGFNGTRIVSIEGSLAGMLDAAPAWGKIARGLAFGRHLSVQMTVSVHR